VWTAVCEPSKYLLDIHAGTRDGRTAVSFVRRALDKVAHDHIPTFVTDGYNAYKTALKGRYGIYVRPKDRKGRTWARTGRDEFLPHPDLNYGQVVKTRDGRKLEKVERRIVFGKVPEDVLNTSAVERENLSIRLFNSRARRRTTAYARSKRLMNDSLELYRNVRNLCSDHRSLCVPRKENGGSYEHVTPAMAIGLTDRPWTMRELMAFSYR